MANEKYCAICSSPVIKEDAPVLSMGNYGNPRLLCEECEELIETALHSQSPAVIEDALERLGKAVGDGGVDDEAVVSAVEEIFKTAGERLEKIKDGTYDFSLDEEEESDVPEDVPEELLESEEDRLQTEREEEASRKFNKIMDIITGVVFAAAAVLLVIWFILR